jgi:serine/threonine-protein kinase RsbW
VDTNPPPERSTQVPGAAGDVREKSDSGSWKYTRVAFSLPACIEHRHLVLNMLAVLLEHVETTDQQFRDELITAFGEAFNNVVIHGYGGRSDGMLQVEADLGSEQITIRLIDTGIQVDFAHVAPPDWESMPEGGMGVFMIHSLVDKVEYRGGPVNVLSLTKRMSRTPTTSR